MVRVLLKFGKEIVDKPITSKIILEQKTPINILAAHVNQDGGEILAEIEPDNAQKLLQSFREQGVIVDVRNLIEIINDRCTDCGACYSLCPVNAITLQKDYSVEFNKEKCLGSYCSLCVDACPTRAIRLIG